MDYVFCEAFWLLPKNVNRLALDSFLFRGSKELKGRIYLGKLTCNTHISFSDSSHHFHLCVSSTEIGLGWVVFSLVLHKNWAQEDRAISLKGAFQKLKSCQIKGRPLRNSSSDCEMDYSFVLLNKNEKSLQQGDICRSALQH